MLKRERANIGLVLGMRQLVCSVFLFVCHHFLYDPEVIWLSLTWSESLFVVPTTEEDRLWVIVKENAADFNAWTALIQETKKLLSSPCPVKPFLTICISVGLSVHYIENWGKFAMKANRDFTPTICIYSLIQAGFPVSFSWARVTAVRNKFWLMFVLYKTTYWRSKLLMIHFSRNFLCATATGRSMLIMRRT